MEILVKEIINLDEYNVLAEKHRDDPALHPQPEYEFRKSLVGVPDYDIIMYRVLEQGIIEPNKKEIHILTPSAALTAFYSKELHEKLKGVIEYHEQVERKLKQKEIGE